MGFVVRDMPKQIDGQVLEKLAQCQTATIGHTKQLGFMDRRIRSMVPGKRTVGTAVTVALAPQDQTMLSHAFGLLRPGDFLVVDRLGDQRHAGVGGATVLAMKQAGAAGVVIDGPCADVDEIVSADFPVWSTGVSGITNRIHGIGGACNVPISCGGAAVLPGYAVLADDGGVLVLEPGECEALADWALAKQVREPETHTRIRSGEKMGDISGASDKVRDGQAEWF